MSLTDDDKHAMSKSMAERQTIEAIKLESNLREGEIKEINAVVQVGAKQSKESSGVLQNWFLLTKNLL